MVRLLGYNSQEVSEDECPREIPKTPSPMGDGWLVRFFDSSFFCEWIAVSYLYKNEHSGVRDYLCNKMYTLPLSGIESYLFQLCYMMVYKSSAALEKFMVDSCSRSLKIALKVHWFLQAEAEEADDAKEFSRLLEKCQMAALTGDWPPLIRPKKMETSPGSKSRMLNKILSSRRLLNLTGSPPLQKVLSPVGAHTSVIEEEAIRSPSEDSDSSLKVFKKLMPGPKVHAIMKKFQIKEDDETDRSTSGESESFFRRILREKDDDEKTSKNEELANSESFFRRMFKDKSEIEEKVGNKIVEDEGFFKRLFRDKVDDRDKKDDRDKLNEEEEKGLANTDEEESPDFSLFRRFLRIHPEDDDKPGTVPVPLNTIESSPVMDGFFKRLFKDRNLEESKNLSSRKEDGMSPSNLLKKFFKEKTDELSSVTAEDHTKVGPDHGSNPLKEASKEPQYIVKNDPKEEKKVTAVDARLIDAMNGCVLAEINTRTVSEDNEPSDSCHRSTEMLSNTVNGIGLKGPGSPKQRTERAAAKPPLPKYSSFHLRKGTYHATLDFIQSLCDTSTGLVDVYPMEDRQKSLHESLAELNAHLLHAQNDGGVCFPLGKGLYRVLHVPEEEATLLNSREKAPYLICVEVIKSDEQSTRDSMESGPQKLSRGIPLANGDVQLPKPPPWAYPVWNQSKMQHNNTDAMLRAASQAIDRAMTHLWETKVKFVHVGLSVSENRCSSINCHHSTNNSAVTDAKCSCDDSEEVASHNSSDALSLEWGGTSEQQCHQWVRVHLTAVPGVNMEDIEPEEPSRRKDHRRVPSTVAMAQVKAAAAKGESPLGLPRKKNALRTGHGQSEDRDDVSGKATDALAGELWEAKKERIRKTSKYGGMSGWDLFSVIVKSGDDCRQEHLAVQLISHFYDIYQEAGLPLWLRPYEVLVTSSYTALIETIPDTASIHSIKSRNPNISSLREFFCNKYEEDSPAFKVAQRNFVESMAGYSILCYLLQVKDRHNGNLLLDEEGHIIHIDFGFMLSNSPGGVNFESAPFKLTRELLEVMDSDAEGTTSEFFDYFKVLCIQGFLTCRKHAERIILLVEMMQDSGFPCFKGGAKTIQNLRKRFHLSLTEEQCVSLVLSLISNSLDAWRTRQYDYYQRVLNGIL
ncbi:hypothetical protein KP509_14G057500 [Ceratopteris richardii]|uniref:1-phosphatidylinositol 4-kinase n=1 Tax=Ceratopteris richardii TaxID=49495 RepID=A0A8T2TF79_CERRI|nr:hypothetical protein KP509_14G057500 [Ceratopteris richardii]KAH7415712.1 hypothetical protein KP509_14G057500 [Ceratopteris richardii]